jgi:AcrR family transcriptional regulator
VTTGQKAKTASMNIRENIRPGGRSARVQASVHKAVRELLSTMDRNEVTIPLIATEAGVTPSTIYRRWGDLQELLADVAVERLRPDAPPKDTGSARTDLEQWAEQYADEMASGPGRAMIRDVLSSVGADSRNAGKCCGYTREQVQAIADRARDRGEDFPDVETVIDRLVAPIMYRILFDAAPPTSEKVLSLVEGMLPHRQ